MKLHTVNKSPNANDALSQCLAIAADGAVVLLLEDGVFGALRGGAIAKALTEAHARLRICALADDVAARGLDGRLLEGVELVDYAEFVRLAAACDAVVAWH